MEIAPGTAQAVTLIFASIAAELIASPGLFFLDEPTSGLDPGLTRRVTEIVRELAAQGSTVVVISHDVESLLAAD